MGFKMLQRSRRLTYMLSLVSKEIEGIEAALNKLKNKTEFPDNSFKKIKK